MASRTLRWLSFLLSLLAVLGAFAVRTHATDEAYLSAKSLTADDIIGSQDSEEAYRLGDGMTRAEMAKVLFGFYNDYQSEDIIFSCTGDVFPDVTSDNAFCRYIEPLATKGIFKTGQDFRPDDTITRAEMVVLLIRVIGETPSVAPVTFSDMEGSFSTFAPSIWRAVELGIVHSGETFRPGDPVSRGEAFIMIERVRSGRDVK